MRHYAELYHSWVEPHIEFLDSPQSSEKREFLEPIASRLHRLSFHAGKLAILLNLIEVALLFGDLSAHHNNIVTLNVFLKRCQYANYKVVFALITKWSLLYRDFCGVTSRRNERRLAGFLEWFYCERSENVCKSDCLSLHTYGWPEGSEDQVISLTSKLVERQILYLLLRK